MLACRLKLFNQTNLLISVSSSLVGALQPASHVLLPACLLASKSCLPAFLLASLPCLTCLPANCLIDMHAGLPACLLVCLPERCLPHCCA